jgi:molybdate transport system substrate-binding protein
VKVSRRRAFLLMLLTLVAGPARGAEPLRVLAAASLTDSFNEIAAAFDKVHPGSKVELSFAGSQVLRTQIEQGAPADVFASADLVHAEALKTSGFLKVYGVFARNSLVVVAATGKGRVDRIEDLAVPGVKLVIAGPAVPAGRYAREVIANLARSGAYGKDLEARVKANIVSEETNVRVVLSKVALGEADAGLVYRTDASDAGDAVRTLAIPDAHNVVAEYPIGVVAGSADPKRAQAFVDFVTSAAGQTILHEHGFR